MSELGKLGTNLRKSRKDADFLTRRVTQNFPLIDRKLEKVSGNIEFSHEFPVTNHNHTVMMSLQFKPENCCYCNQGSIPLATRDMIAYYPDYGTTGGDGIAYPATWGKLEQQGVNLNPGYSSPWFHPYIDIPDYDWYRLSGPQGIEVPMDGVYSISVMAMAGGSDAPDAYATLYIKRGDQIITKRTLSGASGTLPDRHNILYLYANCVPLWQGNVVDSWMETVGVPIEVDNSCIMTMNLVGTGYGALSGIVRNVASGTGIAGATVSYTLGFGGSTTTNQDGYYQFTNLIPGTYTFTATSTGFRTESRDVVIPLADMAYEDFPMVLL